MRIIPAIDIIDGKCVRLTKGDYSAVNLYCNDPVEMAIKFEDAGCKYLHVVDLDGARAKHVINAKTLEKIACNTNLKIDFGGGIKSNTDIKTAFECGAAQVTAGSVAIADHQLFMEWIENYGPEKIILGADFRNNMIAFNGWANESDIEVFDFVKSYCEEGVKYCICTDISCDGMLSGPSHTIYNHLVRETGINIIASGGITTLSDLAELEEAGCEGAIIGKALYENRITLKELSQLC
jgi:phosphoribosylformimino-5-aminoimidazole carboxamide ribotide isomerase